MDAQAIREEAAFLCARARELEGEFVEDDAACSYFFGHVIPPLARLEALLAEPLSSDRFDERQTIIAYIRKRSQSVANLAKSGRLTEADAHRLKRWLGALADDIDAQLHDESDE